jgi:hypothetical protein
MAGQVSTQLQQMLHLFLSLARRADERVKASCGHWSTQYPHPRHRSMKVTISIFRERPSGLWHHQHDNGHPLKKTVMRMRPFCAAWCLMANMVGFTIFIGVTDKKHPIRSS